MGYHHHRYSPLPGSLYRGGAVYFRTPLDLPPNPAVETFSTGLGGVQVPKIGDSLLKQKEDENVGRKLLYRWVGFQETKSGQMPIIILVGGSILIRILLSSPRIDPPCRHNPHLASGLWSAHKHRRDWAYRGFGGTIIIHFSGHHRSHPLPPPNPKKNKNILYSLLSTNMKTNKKMPSVPPFY